MTLRDKLNSGKFVTTVEIGPPRSSDGSDLMKIIDKVKGCADAYNITDNQTAAVRMSSLAGSVICLQNELEPIMQMVCRDRNRIAMQSDVLGASALGVKNILCLSGDHQIFGTQPDAKNVYDIDSTQQLMIFSKMRSGKLWSDDELKTPPDLFLGAVTNPFGDPRELHVIRLANKSAAGAEFVQTQPVFDVDAFQDWLNAVTSAGINDRTKIIAGILPMKSYDATKRLSKVPGMAIPANVVERMRKASDGETEGIRIASETIERLRGMKGISGIHIMPVHWYSGVRRLAETAGIIP